MVMDASVDPAVFEGVSAVRSGTAPLDPDLARAFSKSVTAFQSSPITARPSSLAQSPVGHSRTTRNTAPQNERPSGRPAKGTDLRVVDQESGEELSVGEVGILEVRSPQLNATGWMRTTDLASLDSDGFLYIHGRSDDAVIRGGFKIVPSLVEDALRLHPAVLDASMAGIADERLGAVPVAAVVLARVPQPSQRLSYWSLRDRLARYQVPVAIKVVDQLPRTPSMKVRGQL